jgi:RES domain-containing protein
VRVFRICRKAFARNPLDGRGGLFAAGRWHTPRRPITYASESLALASLEVLVHCDIDLVPTDLVAIEIFIPDDVSCTDLPVSKLPRNWRRHPAPASVQRLGNLWLDACEKCVLRVPSAVIPTESNLLLNPRHPDMAKIKVTRRFDFRFDSRLVPR